MTDPLAKVAADQYDKFVKIAEHALTSENDGPGTVFTAVNLSWPELKEVFDLLDEVRQGRTITAMQPEKANKMLETVSRWLQELQGYGSPVYQDRLNELRTVVVQLQNAHYERMKQAGDSVKVPQNQSVPALDKPAKHSRLLRQGEQVAGAVQEKVKEEWGKTIDHYRQIHNGIEKMQQEYRQQQESGTPEKGPGTKV